MGSPIKIFDQAKDEINVIENFNMKNETCWLGER